MRGGAGDHIKRPGNGIDDGSAGDSDFRIDISVAAGNERVGAGGRDGYFAGGAAVGGVDEVGVPELDAGSAVGVEGVDAVVLGGDEDDVLLDRGDGEIGDPEWLRIDDAIDGA